MSVQQLAHLNEEDRELVLHAPALVSLLIGAADEDFDNREISQAIKSVNYRGFQGEPLLFDYYQAVEPNFENVFRHMMQKYEGQPDELAKSIISELERLNDVLPKVDKRFARVLLESLRSLAKQVAKASGGFLGFEQISEEESHFVDLKMITYNP